MQPHTMEPAPRKILHTLNFNDDHNRATSPLQKYMQYPQGEANYQNHDQNDKNHYDIQGYCKRMNDMMTKQEDIGEFSTAMKSDQKNANLTNSKDNGHNLLLKIKTENEDQENKLPNTLTPYMKKEAGTPFDRMNFCFGKDFSPRVNKDLLLSPLFSATNPHGGFFSSFTPRYFSNFPTMNEGTKGDDFGHMEADGQPRFDNNLKLESRIHTAPILGEHQKGLNLDIDLIDDSFLHVPITKSPNFQFPGGQQTRKCSFNNFGDWSLSPSASFLPKKKF